MGGESLDTTTQLKHKLTVDELRKITNPKNTYLADSQGCDFFEKGNGGISQLMTDLARNYQFGNKGTKNPEGADETQCRDFLHTIFGTEDDTVINAHSQGPSYFVCTILGSAYYKLDMRTNLLNAIIKSDAPHTINVFKDNDGIIRLEFYAEFINIEFLNRFDDMISTGKLNGPVRSVYKLTSKNISGNITWGYELEYVESNNLDVINIIKDNPITTIKLFQRYCKTGSGDQYEHMSKAVKDPYFQNLIDAFDELEIALNSNINQDIKNKGRAIINEAITAYYHKAPLEILIKVIKATTDLVKDPTNQENINAYIKLANSVSATAWGQRLGGTMMALAGVTLALACVGLALVSFGALAPLSILGLTLGASIITGGIAVGCGATIGLGAAFAGTTLFAKSFKPREMVSLGLKLVEKQPTPSP